MKIRGAEKLAQNLREQKQDAFLFRKLATLRTDVPIKETIDDLEWKGARKSLKKICHELGDGVWPARINKWLDV